MTHTQLVCPVCKALVDIVDKTIVQHGDCIMSGMHHVPSRGRFQATRPGAPKVELLGLRQTGGKCTKGCCSIGEAVLKITPPQSTMN